MLVEGFVLDSSRFSLSDSGADAILSVDTNGVAGAEISVTLSGWAGLQVADLIINTSGADTIVKISNSLTGASDAGYWCYCLYAYAKSVHHW